MKTGTKKIIMRGELDGQKKNHRMAPGIWSIYSDWIWKWNWKNDIWTGTFIIETANADWWIGD